MASLLGQDPSRDGTPRAGACETPRSLCPQDGRDGRTAFERRLAGATSPGGGLGGGRNVRPLRLVLLCYKTLVVPRRASTPATGETLQQHAREEFVHRGDRGGDMPFRPHRERPAA